MASETRYWSYRGLRYRPTNAEWLAILVALVDEGSRENRRLAKRLLHHSKLARQLRLVSLLRAKAKRLKELQAILKASRRTLFRDLNQLEDYGTRFYCSDSHQYELVETPDKIKRLIRFVKSA